MSEPVNDKVVYCEVMDPSGQSNWRCESKGKASIYHIDEALNVSVPYDCYTTVLPENDRLNSCLQSWFSLHEQASLVFRYIYSM